ncbi:hypothetical protein [Sphingobium aquiterrae]|uniref:hypothetical protein n=1 Tax=Sphingobium aquiterrae TaxID=2038656 RepID=UPI0030182AC7|tara:strand:+ start:200 stop:358 length:159 start_codon:yes stop_codon:yes gene_type:complete
MSFSTKSIGSLSACSERLHRVAEPQIDEIEKSRLFQVAASDCGLSRFRQITA